jgi:hypothetical protein
MNKKQLSVQPLWCQGLPLQQQSVLFLGTRGPDGIGKFHPAKGIQRAYRATVFLAAYRQRSLKYGEKADTFMCLEAFGSNHEWEKVVKEFFQVIDELPHHYLMHLMHGAQILGYKHPLFQFSNRWLNFYLRMVEDMHLRPESVRDMDARLNDFGNS